MRAAIFSRLGMQRELHNSNGQTEIGQFPLDWTYFWVRSREKINKIRCVLGVLERPRVECTWLAIHSSAPGQPLLHVHKYYCIMHLYRPDPFVTF